METLTLKLFWTCMILCASFALIGIWVPDMPEAWYKGVATFFILGFANFLIWAPLMAYNFLRKEAR